MQTMTMCSLQYWCPEWYYFETQAFSLVSVFMGYIMWWMESEDFLSWTLLYPLYRYFQCCLIIFTFADTVDYLTSLLQPDYHQLVQITNPSFSSYQSSGEIRTSSVWFERNFFRHRQEVDKEYKIVVWKVTLLTFFSIQFGIDSFFKSTLSWNFIREET